jgi:hypothetical protein
MRRTDNDGNPSIWWFPRIRRAVNRVEFAAQAEPPESEAAAMQAYSPAAALPQ